MKLMPLTYTGGRGDGRVIHGAHPADIINPIKLSGPT